MWSLLGPPREEGTRYVRLQGHVQGRGGDMRLAGHVVVVFITLLNLFYLYGTGRRLYKFDQDSTGRLGDILIMSYILAQEAAFILLW